MGILSQVWPNHSSEPERFDKEQHKAELDTCLTPWCKAWGDPAIAAETDILDPLGLLNVVVEIVLNPGFCNKSIVGLLNFEIIAT